MTLEPMKLPGKLGQFTGTVMYPNDESAVWDVNRKPMTLFGAHLSFVYVLCAQSLFQGGK